MNLLTLNDTLETLKGMFTQEWAQAALVMALFSILMVIGLFTYLNFYTQKKYFSLWTMGWVMYALFLGASIFLEEQPGHAFLIMARRACIGMSALYMFFGSLEFAGRGRPQRELYLGAAMIALWSAVAAFVVQEILWITVPVFVLLAVASIYTGCLYVAFLKKYRGSLLLAIGFCLWGVHLLGLPFMGLSAFTEVGGYITTAVLALFIAMGMVVQTLEESRARNRSLLEQVQQDLAQQHVLVEQVNQTEQKYQALFESASDATFIVGLETGKVLTANQAAEHLTRANGVPLADRVFSEICPAVQLDGKNLLEDKKRFDEVFQPFRDFKFFRLDGSTITCEGAAKLIQHDKRPAMQVNLHEVTERRRLEQQLHKFEKLSALGQLIAGVAHELNNPLAVIMGYAQLLNKRADVPPKMKTELTKMFHESERAAKIVRNLLTFARPREPEMASVNLNTVVSNVLDACEGELKAHSIPVERKLSTQLPRTKADLNQLEQVLTNLVRNAVQAQANQTQPRSLEVSTREYGAFIRITVADTGSGIPQDILGKIFDPFFTTKAPGQGTGLGLAICHAIVEEHHGKIWAQSEPRKGAKFFVELPIVPCAEDAAATTETPADAGVVTETEQLDNAHHRILIVDDEPGIVEVLKEALSYHGYVIDTAGNGAIALQRIQAEHYSLIVSDLRMPDMDGEKLYHAVRRLKPELAANIIFLTGDTVSSNSRTFLDWTGNRWFSKPFNVGDLEEVIRNFLRQPQLTPV